MVSKKRSTSSEKLTPTNLLYFTPLVLSLAFYTTLLDPFNSPKLWILVLVSVWILGQVIVQFRLLITPVTTKLLVLIFFFLLSLTVAGFFSDNLQKAVIGETQRRTGILFYSAMCIFLFASAIFISRNSTKRIYLSSTILSIFLICYGFVQHSGNDPVSWDNPYNSIILSLGNPNYASALMAILAVLIFAFSMHLAGLKRITLAALGMFLLLLIIFSNSRQGLVAFGFGISIVLGSYIFKQNLKLGYIFLQISALVGLMVILGMLQIGPLEKYVYKTSVSIRGFYWRTGIDMFLSRPLTGVGLDSYGDYFREFRNVQYPLRFGFQITSDNAHNVPIQLLSTGGIFVGLSYIFLLLFIFWNGVILLKKSQRNEIFLNSGIFGAWISYTAQSIISIDNVGLTIWGWLLGGTVIGLANLTVKDVGNEKYNLSAQKISTLIIKQNLYSFILILPVIFGVSAHYRVESDMYKLASLANTVSTSTPVPFNNAILRNSLISTNKLKLLDSNHKLTIAIFFRDNGDFNDYDKVISNLVINDPNCLVCLRVRAETYESNSKWNEALNQYIRISKSDPWNAENYLRIANLYQLLGNTEGTIQYLDKILAFAPNTDVGKQAFEGKMKILNS